MKNKVFKYVFLPAVIYLAVWFGNVQHIYGQAAVHDSIRHMLVYFHETARDEKLKRAVKEAQALFINNTIHDSLASKLLIAENLVLKSAQPDMQIVLGFAEKLAVLFSQLPPREQHAAYAFSLSNLGDLYERMGEYKKSLSFHQQALTIRRNVMGSEHPDYASSLNSLGNVYISLGEYDKALPVYQQSLAIRKKRLGEKHPDYATSLGGVGSSYRDLGEYEKALPLLQQSLALRKEILGNEHPDYAGSLHGLAYLYYLMGKDDKALQLIREEIMIRKKVQGEEHADYAVSLNGLAYIYLIMGKYEQALPLFQKALTILKKAWGDEHPEYANSLNGVAIICEKMGQFEKALPLHQRVLAIRKKVFGEESADYATSLSYLAILYQNLGDYGKSLLLFKEGIAIRKKASGDQHPDYATSLVNLAYLYHHMGEYGKALILYEEALAIAKTAWGEEHPNYAGSLNNLALLYRSMGEYVKALTLFREALEIRKKALGEDHPDYASSLNNLALLYRSMGEYEKAQALYREALVVKKIALGEQHPDYASSLNNLAYLYQSMGEYGKALPLYQEALAITKKALGEEHPDYAGSLNNLAFHYYRLGQYQKALPLYKEALTIRKRTLGEAHPEYAANCNNLGLLYSITGNHTDAVALFVKASTIKLKHLTHTYSSLSEQEKMVFLNNESSPFSFLPSLLFNQQLDQPAIRQQAYAIELALKGMVLEDQQHVLQSIRKSGDSSSLQLFEQWRLNKIFAGKQLLLPLAERVPTFDSLQQVTTQLEQQLSLRAASFRNQLQSHAITAKDISRKLVKGEAAVEFLRFNLYNKKWTDSIMYAAMVLSPGDSIASFIPLFEEKQLQRLLSPPIAAVHVDAVIQKLYRGVIVSGSETGSLHDSLYQLIWKPLEKYLAGMNTVYYAPAGLLHRIAFQALRPDFNHMLIDKYQLNQVLSTRAVALPERLSEKPVSASIWGNIQYDLQSGYMASRGAGAKHERLDTSASSFNFYTSDTRTSRGEEWISLPGTMQEIDSLKTVFRHAGISMNTNSGEVASEEAFKALDGKSPQILHLATHGFFLPIKAVNNQDAASNTFTVQQNPMFRSGLVLAGANYAWKGGAAIPGREDGILTAYEIAQMDLGNTDLVVLSACETALGDLQGNEGVIGLQRALKMAGVKQMIMSLWRVPDKETMELMTMFYRYWLGGRSIREALREAQLKMKEKYPPYYWAAFVVVE